MTIFKRLPKVIVQVRKIMSADLAKSFSSETKDGFVNVQINESTQMATLTMQRHPVNALNLELIQSINEALKQLKEKRVKGVILTSASPTVFSAGLDLEEFFLVESDPKRFTNFWTSLQDLWINLYGAPYRTVAAINGQSPAGGCLLALSCEYRVMINKAVIGFNETRLGIAPPPFFVTSMKNVLGTRQTELAILEGKLFSSEEALKIGLIDEMATSKEELVEKSEAYLNRFKGLSPLAVNTTKDMIRKKDIDDFVKVRQYELEMVMNLLKSSKKILDAYKASLKKK